MNKKTRTSVNLPFLLQDQSGAVAIVIGLILSVLLAIVALAVDIGYLAVSANEAQNVADAAALAGARRMGENYYAHLDPSQNVESVTQSTAQQNTIAGRITVAANVDPKIGTWDPPFTETSTYPNAVQVIVKREGGGADGAIKTFFARTLGINTMNISRPAVAAISGTCEVDLTIPLGIGRGWFENDLANRGCKQIAVNSTPNSCAGWTNLSNKKYDHKDVQDMLEDTTKIPTVTVGDTLMVSGGTTQQVVNALDALFRDKEKFKDAKTFDAKNNVLTWTTSVIVYEDKLSCENPIQNKGYELLGFATITITDVILTGKDKGPVGTIQCHVAEQERGGCYYAGTYGVIPGLVK